LQSCVCGNTELCAMPKRVAASNQPRPAAAPQPQQMGEPQQRPDGQPPAQAPQLQGKKVKREYVEDNRPLVPDQPKRQRTNEALPSTPRGAGAASAVPGTPGTAPSPVRVRSGMATPNTLPQPETPGATPVAVQPAAQPARGAKRGGRRSGDGIAWVLSDVRNQLEAIADVEGILDLLESFPECVLLGGIAARRELVAALLGEHAVANSAAALLVAPGMRQPVALELRCGQEDFGPANGPEAEAWLRSVAQAAGQALGQRLKVDALRLRLSAMGCANLDVVDLPERTGAAGANPKMEEMRQRFVGNSANLLVCLEPGASLELCKRFDPQFKRTVLIGAATSQAQVGGNDQLPAFTLCGPAAATALEERFAALCNERVPQWVSQLERLEARLSRSQKEAREMERRESSDEVLRRARAVGLSFGRALQHVVSGTPGCTAGAMTLEEEITEFASAASKGHCDIGGDGSRGAAISSKDAFVAANDLFSNFGGAAGYAAYLRDQVRIPGSDVPLNGGAAWQRLLAEIDVAMRLAHPPQEELAGLMLAAVRAGGTGVHGHQRWEEVASKLMLSVSFEPLRRRVRYVASRVVWVLKHQKATVSEWMSTLAEGPSSRFYSPLFTEHLDILRTYPIVRELVFTAYDKAASGIGEQVLKNLEGTLVAACINPDIMLRPSTEPDINPAAQAPELGVAGASPSAAALGASPRPMAISGRTRSTPAIGRASAESRQRVAAEMKRRSCCSGGLPIQLRDRVFEPAEAAQTMPFVEAKLRRAFSKLARILANQSFAFADTSMAYLCQRRVDEAMTAIDFSTDQQRALQARHEELESVAKQVEQRLAGVRRCIAALRSAIPGSSLGFGGGGLPRF